MEMEKGCQAVVGCLRCDAMRGGIPIRIALILGFMALYVAAARAQPSIQVPTVPAEMLKKCERQITADCVSDIAFFLAQSETRGFQLQELAYEFAKSKKRGYVEELWKRVPEKNRAAGRLSANKIEAEQLSDELRRGNVAALRHIESPHVLSWTASYLLGYLPRDDVPKRLNEGFGSHRPAKDLDRAIKVALLERWESLSAESPDYLRINLANKWLLLGENARAEGAAAGV